MDQLDKLKGAWKSQDYSDDQVSTKDIYKMLHAKSSSYVKWIFYISIIEFILINSIYFFYDTKKEFEFFEKVGLGTVINTMTIISTIIIIGFIYQFYKNYRSIRIDTSAKSLMDSILKTRKTVKYYIYYNIGMGAAITTYIYFTIFSNQEYFELFKIKNKVDATEISDTILMTVFIATMVVMLLLFLLFYRIVYGILLKRLKKNHKELAQLGK